MSEKSMSRLLFATILSICKAIHIHFGIMTSVILSTYPNNLQEVVLKSEVHILHYLLGMVVYYRTINNQRDMLIMSKLQIY